MNQTFTDGVECIIVNDCTPDRSMEIVEQLVGEYKGDIKFVLLYHKNNCGIAEVRNTGIAAANGDYITFIDSDDFIESNMLEKMYDKAVKENADIVIADYWVTYNDREVYHSQFVPKDKTDAMKELVKGSLKGFNCNKMFRRSLYTKNHVHYIKGIDAGEDLIVCVKMFYFAEKIVGIPSAFLHYVQYNLNASSKQTSLEKMKCFIYLDTFFVDFFKSKGDFEYYREEILTRKIVYQKTLLFSSKGKLQRKICERYKNITPLIVLKNGSGLSLYWRIAIFFVSLRLLPVFNLMRGVWRIMRPALGKNLVLFDEDII